MKSIRFYFWLALIFCTATVYGQQAIVKGKVTDADTKEPVPFASVITEGGSGAATDFDGNFEYLKDLI